MTKILISYRRYEVSDPRVEHFLRFARRVPQNGDQRSPTMKRRLFASALAMISISIPLTGARAADRTAASCSSADVQAAVNAATSGDRVLVPAGSCTYTSAVNIPNGKNITIQGA